MEKRGVLPDEVEAPARNKQAEQQPERPPGEKCGDDVFSSLAEAAVPPEDEDK
jgi:hypothetical protein